jgi:hypothetical protein
MTTLQQMIHEQFIEYSDDLKVLEKKIIRKFKAGEDYSEDVTKAAGLKVMKDGAVRMMARKYLNDKEKWSYNLNMKKTIMKPIEFKEQNSEIAKDQDEYLTLPAFRANDEQGTMITCNRLSFKERLIVLFTGKIWMSELTFKKPVTPRSFYVNKWDVLDKDFFNQGN